MARTLRRLRTQQALSTGGRGRTNVWRLMLGEHRLPAPIGAPVVQLPCRWQLAPGHVFPAQSHLWGWQLDLPSSSLQT